MMHKTGTWHVNGGCIVDENDNIVAVRKSWENLDNEKANREHVMPIRPAEADENARLIASAPELLDALVCAILHLQDADRHAGWHIPEAEWQTINAAIDKAAGG